MIDKKKADWWNGAIGNSYNSFMQAWLDEGEEQTFTLPTGRLLTRLNNFCEDAAANLAEADIWYAFKLNDANLGNFARINVANPGSNLITVVSGAVYGAGGYAGDASADYLDANWQPANGVKFTLNDASIIMSKTGSMSSSKFAFGCHKTTATASRTRMFWNTNLLRGHINDNAEVSESGVADEPWVGMIRTSSTGCGIIQSSGTSSETSTSTQLTPLNMFILGLNLNGALSSPCDGNAEFFAAGSSAMMTGLKAKWNSFIASE